MNHDSSTGSWKKWRWVSFDLILIMRDIYINSNLNPLTKSATSSRSTKHKGIFPWNISQMIMKTVPISIRIVISYTMKWDIPFWVWQNINGNWEIKWSQFPNGGKATAEQILASEDRNRAELSESQSGLWVGKLTIWIKSILSIKPNPSDIPKILNANGTTITNPVEIANVFNNYFSSIASQTKVSIKYSNILTNTFQTFTKI